MSSPFLAACPPLPGSLKKKTRNAGALRGQLSEELPPFLESSFPLTTAMSGGHAGPVGRLFLLDCGRRGSPPHSLFLLFLPSLPPWASGQSRGLGDVEGHDQSAGCRSRALSGDPGRNERRAQLPGNVACGRLTPLLSLQPVPPLSPGSPGLWSLARRSS